MKTNACSVERTLYTLVETEQDLNVTSESNQE